MYHIQFTWLLRQGKHLSAVSSENSLPVGLASELISEYFHKKYFHDILLKENLLS